ALLGRTRAAVLLAIAERPHLNTTELARRLGTSLASASQHVTVLREAGLTITNRHNGSAMHHLSNLGEDLLTGRPPRPPTSRCPLTSGSL
ncbi:MAG: winged helix-turn-helix domain-containing protein, partial [Actinomycetota bacterium]|nr:winged helix-turn-helix domain-containing protein [Actinomycetota bacterium]